MLCKAEINIKKIQKPNDKYLVIASDGLWSIVEAIEVISLIEKNSGTDCRSIVTLSEKVL